MRKRQWFVLGAGFYALGMLFASMSIQWKGYCVGEVYLHTIEACIRGHTFASYPYIFFALSTLFIICGCLEWIPKKEKIDKKLAKSIRNMLETILDLEEEIKVLKGKKKGKKK